MDRAHAGAVGGFLALSVLWGLSFVAGRAAVADVPPVALAALRFALAGPLTVVAAATLTDRWRPRERGEWRVVALAGLLFVAAHHALLFAGQRFVTSAVAGVVISLDPVLAAGFAWVLLPDERPDPAAVVGVVVGLAGAAVVAAPDPGTLSGADPRGVGLVFGSAAAFALGAVLVRRDPADPPAAVTQAWAMVVGTPLLFAATLVVPGESIEAATWTPRAVWGLAYLVVGGAGAGYLVYFHLLERIGPVEVNLVGYVAPLVAALGGWLLLGERVAPTTVVGFGVIVCGFALVKRDALWEELARRRSA